LARLLDDTYKDEGGARTTTVSSIIELSLNAYSQHRTDASGSLKLSVETLDTLRQHHLEIILKTLEQQSIEHLGSCENRHYHSVNLECLVGYSELLTIHPRLRESK